MNIYSGRRIDEGSCNECHGKTEEVFVVEIGITSVRLCAKCLKGLYTEIKEAIMATGIFGDTP